MSAPDGTSRPPADQLDLPAPDDHVRELGVMSFGDHLDELRRRLLLALVAPFPLFIGLFFVSDTLIEWILLPVYEVLRSHGLPTDLQVLSPPEFVLAKMKLSLIGALVIAAPWILYQAWIFIAPGLYKHERRFVYFLIPGSAVLTAAGVVLLYYVMLPLMLHVLVLFGTNIKVDTSGPHTAPAVQQALADAVTIDVRLRAPDPPAHQQTWLKVPEMRLHVALVDADTGAVEIVVVPPSAGGISQTFRVTSVINFTLILMLGMVVAFQLPLVLMLLGWLGLADAKWLRQKRRYALVVCALISAVVTPADAVSLVIMLVPLYGLYELGILLMMFVPASAVSEGRLLRFRAWRRRPRKDAAGTGSDPDKRV